MTKTRWTAEQIPDQEGRTFVVTGANSGLGYETARALAAKGARVVLTARNAERGRAALAKIRVEYPNADLELASLDLADLDSVRAFAAGLDEPVDVLVNNAGVMMPPRTLTKQGFESQFATNHLGHFALTGLLLERLRSRVVTVTSGLHRRGTIQFDDLTGSRVYSPVDAYAQSKLANVLFALELDRRFRAAGSSVVSAYAHPGYSATNLQSSGPTGLLNLLMKPANLLVAQSAEQGALPQLYAATAEDVSGGDFFGPDGLGEMRGYPKRVQPVSGATDPETARKLWEVSEELTGVSYSF
ncbi:oxidoreductase [Allokutzneria albata]|uniref:NAD(P)-dependent dehydrogenase, short-chain alcohol dehydrogenase family n=1 Tax=Allokutzneria albata TaxID=211114 RepID=A0A1G9VGW0_ALLAB|nr:oxidoreductase [Allokutzneria albata]SDM71313.1 NAD(P)-dependent dehydrogenase, short-chain alcohol dehydrogenase family [Allokutzneria albata]